MPPRDLIVDTDALRLEGMGLLDAANDIPAPPEPFSETGSDPLSIALAAKTVEVEAPLIAGLPLTKKEALATAQQIIDTAEIYDAADQRIAKSFVDALLGSDGSGSGSAGSAAVGSAAGGAPAAQTAASSTSAAGSAQSGLSQLAGMPMQMAQQAAQVPAQAAQMAASLPQTLMQGVQSAVQQVSQLAGGGENEKALENEGEPPDEQDPEIRDEVRREDADDEAKGAQSGTGAAAPVETSDPKDARDPVAPLSRTVSTRAMGTHPDVAV